MAENNDFLDFPYELFCKPNTFQEQSICNPESECIWNILKTKEEQSKCNPESEMLLNCIFDFQKSFHECISNTIHSGWYLKYLEKQK